jgi:threonyl-tRNA synthetase
MTANADSIKVHLPDGSIKEFPAGSTPLDVANSISPRLAAAAVIARIRPANGSSNGSGNTNDPSLDATQEASAEAGMYAAEQANAERLVDLTTPLNEDMSLQLLTEKDADALKVVRHSAAHVMATAVLELFPETKLGHGPATDAGFFYDFYRPTPFTPEDLKAIEAKMAEVVARNEPFVREWEPRDQSLDRFKAGNDFMKAHFVERFTKPGEQISFYRNGAFEDFCRGPHVPSTGRVKAYKVTNLAGAYWLGDEKNPQLQRIYGTAFFSSKEMEQHFARLEEAAKRDHRVLGKQLDLFSIQEVAGPGLIFWHPKGAMVRKIMEEWMRDECLRRGYSLVYTPHVARRDLWQISGHEGFYSQNMFTPMELDDADYRLKPMNCPFHILIYKNSPKSYRDLPVRYAELGNVYRYERSGTMHGLLRVRGFTQDDAHIFCSPAQIEDEIVGCIEFAQLVLTIFGFKDFQVELSTWDPKDRKSYTGSDENWALAIGSLERALGRKVMVHRALFGSVERFFGVLIEHYAGAFPLWLAPVQVGIVPISERHVPYAEKIQTTLQNAGLRVEVDHRNEKMGAKIRDFTLQKLPYILVVGDKEAETGAVSLRVRSQGDQGGMPLEDFVARAKSLVDSKSMSL